MKDLHGLTIQLTLGKSAGFKIKLTKISFRICLWFVAFTIFFYDIEEVIIDMQKK